MKLYEPTIEFPFSNIILNTPTALNNTGTYFSKMTFSDNTPIFIQFPTSKTKNGVIMSKQECYMDLLYKHGSEQSLIDWNDQLEEYCKGLIYEKKKLWFSQELDNPDIDRLLSSTIRPYKGGSMLLVRVYIDKSKMSNTLKCQLYDQDENKIHTFESITLQHDIIPLVHLEGIKFTSNSIDIILKVTQMMVLNLDNNYTPEECVIKYPLKPEIYPRMCEKSLPINTICTDTPLEDCKVSNLEEIPDNYNEELGLSEINITLDDEKEVLSLTNNNEIYEEIYKSALDKARNIKSELLSAYLEAKDIKTKYMLDYLEDVEDEYEKLR